MRNLHHAINYIELSVDDLAATLELQPPAFGLQFNEYGPAYAGIRSSDGEGEVGGLNATELWSPADRWCCYSTISMPPSCGGRDVSTTGS